MFSRMKSVGRSARSVEIITQRPTMGSFLSSGTTESFPYYKTDILRREGGIAKYFDLRLAGRRLRIVYAHNVEPPLARRWLAAQVTLVLPRPLRGVCGDPPLPRESLRCATSAS